MPNLLSEILSASVTRELDFLGHKITVEVCPLAFTRERAERLDDTLATEHVAAVVKSWDLVDDRDPANPQPYPLTEAALSELPNALLRAVCDLTFEVIVSPK